MYEPIHQQAVLLKGAETALAAKAFLRYLRSSEVRDRLVSVYGYDVEALALATPERH
jgi:ABC-type molybdate transport system substrate-binding protein